MHECGKSCINSIEIGRAALRIALTSSRVEETKVTPGGAWYPFDSC